MPEVRPERTGWRDQKLSEWHRENLGYDCPMTDIDFLVVDYDRLKPVAIIEYKNEHAKPFTADNANYLALRNLANMAGLPVFVVIYTDGITSFHVDAMNGIAKKFVHNLSPLYMKPERYAKFLYALRDRVPPEDVMEKVRKGDDTIAEKQAI